MGCSDPRAADQRLLRCPRSKAGLNLSDARGLDQMDFDERSKLVRLLVDRVEVNGDDINVVYRVGAGHG